MQRSETDTSINSTAPSQRKESIVNNEDKNMLPHRKITTPPTLTSDRVDRTSFSSVKETDTGVAQSFIDSKTSSYLRNEYSFSGETSEEAVFDDGSVSSGNATPENERERVLGKVIPGTLTNPNSRLHGFVCPCDGFRGWKGISVRGRVASKSSGDLRALGKWDWEVSGEEDETTRRAKVEERVAVGKSPIETLPMELLGSIIDQLATDIPPNGFTARNIDLMSLLLTSRSMHSATLATLYNQITIPHSRIFRKFLSHIAEHPALGTIVRRLDFSHFNPTGAGQTARERAQTQNLTADTLLQCLKLTPNLREFLAQEHVDDELSVDVLSTLLNLPNIKALDFCACSSTQFKDSFTTALSGPLPSALPIARLSLHECSALPVSTYIKLLPLLPQLTHLDVSHTRITDAALLSIPQTARLTHLNISKCASLTGEGVVDFLTNHPAARTLVYLNMLVDVKSHEMLTAEDIKNLLPILPTTLRSLNMKGSKMDKTHISLVIPLTKHVEELGLGRHLELADIKRLFVPLPEKTQAGENEVHGDWVPHSLRYLDVSDLNSNELDLTTLFSDACPILGNTSAPLEVLELSSEVYKKVEKSSKSLERVGWCAKEAGRRGWMVKVPKKGQLVDSGARGWKYGASFWGGRKVPVAQAEVGGMYGHYMFKR